MCNVAIGKLLVFLLLFLTGIDTRAQLKCKIEHYSTEDGLSHDGVMGILKDQEGFMWFGTWDGINRFDGHNFITYKAYPGDNSRLRNNRIGEIVEDQTGFLWLTAYDNQVYRFDKRTESFFAIADLLQEKGISNIAFNKVILGPRGLVWLTTTNQGVFCVRKADSSRPELIPFAIGQPAGNKNAAHQINFLYPDRNNTVWVGSSQGVTRLSQKKDGRYTQVSLPAGAYSKLNFTAVVESQDRIWFGTSNGYLVVYEKKTNAFGARKICGSKINGLLLSHRKEDVLYLVNAQRELLTVNTIDLKASTASMPGKGAFLSVFEDSSGLLWIQPEYQGAINYHPATKAFRFFSQPIDATFHSSVKNFKVFEDHKKRVWVSMQGGGFGYYDPAANAIKPFYNEPGSRDHRFSNYVTSLYLDNTGVLWLCTNDRGIHKIIFQENYFDYNILVPHAANNSDNEIRGVYNDRKNRVWLASKSGKLYVYDQQGLVHGLFVNPPEAGLGIVYTIFEDSKGNIWLGTKGNGLFKAQPSGKEKTAYRLTHYLPDPGDLYSLSGDMVYSILEDRKGRIWIGTYGYGLNLLEQTPDGDRFINMNNSFGNHKLSTHKKIRHLQEGPAGEIWMATTDGLVVMDPNLGSGKISLYKKAPGDKSSLGNNDVQFIFRDSKNNMWVCTSGGGLNQAILSKNKLKFKVFTKQEGLPNDYILSLAEDNSGHLWIATENGISRFDPASRKFKNYDSYDGLQQTGFSEAAAIKLQNGDLLFGARNGYLSFNPAEITNRKVAANMVITNFQINNKDLNINSPDAPLKHSINHTGRISLAYNENTVGIEFTVLDYHASNKLTYAYRLNDFDAGWQQVKNQRKATYTNLPPGDYFFEVKSQDPELFETLPYKKIAITINPPVWRTTWAYLLYIVLALVFLEIVRRVTFSMIRLRNRIAIEQKLTELKLRFFTNISHELRTPLTLIVNPIEAIATQEELTPKSREYIQVVRKNTNRMVRFINQLLDFRKAQSGKMKLQVAQTEMIAFLQDICSHFTEAASEKQLNLSVRANVESLYAWVDVEKMDIVIYNLLSNAFKFSPAQKAITIEVHDGGQADFFTIKVIDQGVGIPADKLSDIFELYYEGDKAGINNLGGTGIGLALAKELVELHHGSITAHNNPTEGATITVALKPGKAHFRTDEVTWLDTPLELSRTYEPVQERLPEVSNTGEGSPAALTLPQVLIVEDNADLRKFLADQLKLYYKVIEAEDGQEGFSKALQHLPDLVLSDVMMPKMDGIQLLDQLKHTLETSHIPVILLTAKTSVEHQIEGLHYGADYYITKPFQTDFILAAVKNLLQQRKKIFASLLGDKKTIDLSPGEIVITSKDEVFLKEVIRIVENGMANPEFNIDTVAETVGMGRTTFYKKFTSLTNLAPVEFVREMRLKRGKQLLDAGESNISEVAYAIGFNNAGYFSTCFKKQYQLTPSEYLKSLKAPLV